MMKTLLLTPLVPFKALWGKFHRAGGFIPPIGILSVAAYIREKGFPVDIVDSGVEGLDEEGLRAFLRERKPAVVGIPCFTNTARHVFQTAAIVRSVLPGALIVLGGVHVTVLPERSLEECPAADVVVIGEGELTFAELLEARRGGSGFSGVRGIAYREDGTIKRTAPREMIADLDSLPLMAYDLLKLERYLPHPTQYKRLPSYPLLATRGCPFECTFCSAAKVHGRRLRTRGLDAVFAEIDLLVGRYGAKGLYIQDSSFLTSRPYVVSFCERMIAGGYRILWMCNARVDQIDEELVRLMKRAGCWQITFGVESANEASLTLVKKRQTVAQIMKAVGTVKRAGLQAYASYILGFPGETAADVERTIEFARHLASQTAIFYLPVPYPGTELLEQCRADGGLREDVAWDDYSSTDFSHPIYVNPRLGKERLLEYYRRAYWRFYSSPRVMWENLRSIRSPDDVRYYWRAAQALLGLWA